MIMLNKKNSLSLSLYLRKQGVFAVISICEQLYVSSLPCQMRA